MKMKIYTRYWNDPRVDYLIENADLLLEALRRDPDLVRRATWSDIELLRRVRETLQESHTRSGPGRPKKYPPYVSGLVNNYRLWCEKKGITKNYQLHECIAELVSLTYPITTRGVREILSRPKPKTAKKEKTAKKSRRTRPAKK